MKNAMPFAVLLVLAPVGADAAAVSPHRAVYDLTLLRANDGANLQSAEGRLAFEVQGSTCEGFTVSFRMAAKYRPAEGRATLIDTQTTAYEGPGALEFRHQQKELVDGSRKDDVRLTLNRESADAEGRGEISSKSGERFTVPAGTALPMQHQLKLMALGESGGGRDSSLVFDGSDGAKVFHAISFVGKQRPPGSSSRDVANPAAAALRETESWPVTVSYFPDDKGEAMPDYQVSFDLYANGVATGLVLDYGDFSLAGTLSGLEFLEMPACP